MTLYRIVQEGLRNISKHACANHVSVSLKGFDQDILLSIQDDGIGFDLAEAGKHRAWDSQAWANGYGSLTASCPSISDPAKGP